MTSDAALRLTSIGIVLVAALAAQTVAGQARFQAHSVSHGVGFTAGDNVRIGVSIGQPLTGLGVGAGSAGGTGFWYTTLERLTVVASEENGLPDGIPDEFQLHPNYPNPFNPSTKIRYGVPEAAHVRISVYNVLGQLTAEVLSEQKTAGYHEVEWDGRDLSGAQATSGVYFYRIQAARFAATRSMVLQK